MAAAMVRQPDDNAFERVTGLPIAMGRLMDRCGYHNAEQVGGLFAALRAGKDYRLVPQRFMLWWFGEESVPWADYLRDTQLVQLLARWRGLCGDRLAGRNPAPEDWAALSEQAASLLVTYQQPDRLLEKNVATLLKDLSPLPVTTDGDKWGNIALNINWAQFQYLEIQSGWSDEERATPDIRMAWFMEKERQSPAGKLTQEDITRLREEWQSLNPGFIEKENAFQKNLPQLVLPVSDRMQQALNRLLADAPGF
ncbi:hypothetical protein LD112_25000 [Pantoea agglomerans]|nr:hypothetical protein [Pantoea agglomerans]